MSDCGGDDCGGGDYGGDDYGGSDVQMTTFDSDYPADTSYSSPDPPAESTEMTYFESSAPADEPSYSYEKNGTFETGEETNVSQVNVFLNDTEDCTSSMTYCTPSRTYYTSSRTYCTPGRTNYTHTSNNYRVSRGATYNDDSTDCCEGTLNGTTSKIVLFIGAVLVGLLVIFLVLKKS